MKQQTAVEFLASKLRPLIYFDLEEERKQFWNIIKQAKAMEKDQIINAYIDGEHQQGFEGEAEQYYNETYKP